ncbi:MAG: hypothetical protein QOD10_5274 [Mycobacterium sp.]|nr:hypothetical protein [Mycobacterium sp.]
MPRRPSLPQFPANELNTGDVVDLVTARTYATVDTIRDVHDAVERPDFKRQILRAFNDGNKHRPHSTFGNVNADVLEYFDASFVRDDFVDIIRSNCWPE